jgi:hypothetical protein
MGTIFGLSKWTHVITRVLVREIHEKDMEVE